jgi:hypothetical protein
MDNEPPDDHLDYAKPVAKRTSGLVILAYVVVGIIISFIAALIAASFLMPAAGGGH